MRRCGVLLVLPLLAALAGCSSPPAPRPSVTVTGSSSPAATVTVTSTATAPAATAPAASAPPATAVQCADDALDVSVQADGQLSGAGQRGSWVVFRNVGQVSCTLHGAPGVSVVGHGNGTQIGVPAGRDTSTGPTVVIPRGGYALALLGYPYLDARGGAYDDGKNGDPKCRAVRADGYRVYPPHSTRAFFVRSSIYACSTSLVWLGVGVVQPSAFARPFVATF